MWWDGVGGGGAAGDKLTVMIVSVCHHAEAQSSAIRQPAEPRCFEPSLRILR